MATTKKVKITLFNSGEKDYTTNSGILKLKIYGGDPAEPG